jgi:SAM-dependent methyltransferase
LSAKERLDGWSILWFEPRVAINITQMDDEKIDFTRLMAMAGGHAEARAIQTALKLGLFEALHPDGCDTHALAAALRCERRATMLLANAMVALGLLNKNGGQYALTDAARKFLLESSPEYLGGMILFDEALWSVWGKLDESIRRGEPARTPDMFQSRPDETNRFIRAMDSLVRARGDAVWVAQALDLSWAQTVADLGGGPGTYLIEFLRRSPHLRGILFDLPATLEVTRRIVNERGSEPRERLTLHELDYNCSEIPGPLDVVFLSNIIHSEDEAANTALVAKCFRALAPGGLLVIKDHIMDAGLTTPAAGAVFSVFMLLTTRGRDYSFEEVAEWMRSAGFNDIRLQVLPSPPFSSSMVIARKP